MIAWRRATGPWTSPAGSSSATRRCRALQFRGTARCQLGDTGGLDDLRAALRRGHELGLGRDTAFGFINLADWVWRTDGPAAGLEVYREGIEFARVRGLAWLATWMRSETCWVLFDLGEWDELLSVAASVLETDWSRAGSQIPLIARTYIARGAGGSRAGRPSR